MLLTKGYIFQRPSKILVGIHRNYATKQELYTQCYSILEIDENSDQNTVRNAYIALVKKLHPDSGHPESNPEKFQQVDRAFKILQGKYAKQRRGIVEDLQSEVKIFDIKHTAPQHRQYLSYDGIGSGTMAQREKQYQQFKASKAQERVLEHRMQKAQASEGALINKKGEYYKKHAIKTKYGFDRVVEDLIQEAMSRGDFQNLKGTGKPLDDIQSQNPYVDFTTHKLNKILFDNGFVPEWITLQKEIRECITDLKSNLIRDRNDLLVDLPLSNTDKKKWDENILKYQSLVDDLNKKIDKYNLIVPVLDKQMIQIQLDRISEKILSEAKNYEEFNQTANKLNSSKTFQTDNAPQGLITLLSSLFSSN